MPITLDDLFRLLPLPQLLVCSGFVSGGSFTIAAVAHLWNKQPYGQGAVITLVVGWSIGAAVFPLLLSWGAALFFPFADPVGVGAVWAVVLVGWFWILYAMVYAAAKSLHPTRAQEETQ